MSASGVAAITRSRVRLDLRSFLWQSRREVKSLSHDEVALVRRQIGHLWSLPYLLRIGLFGGEIGKGPEVTEVERHEGGVVADGRRANEGIE